MRRTLAEDRTVLAAERTFAAWLRTGLAFLGGGLATQGFLADVMGSWPLHLLASTLILCALACFAAAGWRDHWVRRRLAQPHITLLPRIVTLGLSILLTVVAGLAAGALWMG
ncbi:DUF202 domain-containing protein [Falsiroseomonas sp. E2-1-a4]|uniref:DUF202 domain-containing protein n=1 Tax=Falsiroseomonas sp. E2-1-a4 TaxID=3239299 RepID=UPI003F322B17